MGSMDFLDAASVGLFGSLCELLLVGGEQIGERPNRFDTGFFGEFAVRKDEGKRIGVRRHDNPALFQELDGLDNRRRMRRALFSSLILMERWYCTPA